MTMNTTTSVGAHQPTSVPPHLQIRTPYGDIREGPNRTFFCMQCNAPLPYQWPNEYTAMMAAHVTECQSPAASPHPDRPISVGDYVRWETPHFRTWADNRIVVRRDVGTPVGTIVVEPKPLYDGLTAEQCLDRLVDCKTLRSMIALDEQNRREEGGRDGRPWLLTPAQRAAVSAYWSAQLRARVEASEAERKRREVRVLVDLEDD